MRDFADVRQALAIAVGTLEAAVRVPRSLPHRAFTGRAVWAASEAGRPSELNRAIRCMRDPAW